MLLHWRQVPSVSITPTHCGWWLARVNRHDDAAQLGDAGRRQCSGSLVSRADGHGSACHGCSTHRREIWAVGLALVTPRASRRQRNAASGACFRCPTLEPWRTAVTATARPTTRPHSERGASRKPAQHAAPSGEGQSLWVHGRQKRRGQGPLLFPRFPAAALSGQLVAKREDTETRHITVTPMAALHRTTHPAITHPTRDGA